MAVRRQMISTWTEFAKTGDPTPPSSPYSWLPVRKGFKDKRKSINFPINIRFEQRFPIF